eukprot:4552137-Amphidinium_carterae.1
MSSLQLRPALESPEAGAEGLQRTSLHVNHQIMSTNTRTSVPEHLATSGPQHALANLRMLVLDLSVVLLRNLLHCSRAEEPAQLIWNDASPAGPTALPATPIHCHTRDDTVLTSWKGRGVQHRNLHATMLMNKTPPLLRLHNFEFAWGKGGAACMPLPCLFGLSRPPGKLGKSSSEETTSTTMSTRMSGSSPTARKPYSALCITLPRKSLSAHATLERLARGTRFLLLSWLDLPVLSVAAHAQPDKYVPLSGFISQATWFSSCCAEHGQASRGSNGKDESHKRCIHGLILRLRPELMSGKRAWEPSSQS